MLTDHPTPLTRQQARHLLRRACLCADPDRVAEATGRLPREVVEGWLAEPVSTALLPEPLWLPRLYPPSDASDEDVQVFLEANEYYVEEVRERWLQDLLGGSVRARMTLFWHNHFVTDVRKYRYGTLAYAYVQRLTLGAFGNFKALVRGFVTDGSMLYYLDGRSNRRSAPNENFARELLELFTMGPFDAQGHPNYTQEDIVNAARALTGWSMDVRSSWNASLVFGQVDRGQKTIFGRTDNFDHLDVIDLIFEERGAQVAWYLARKLLEEFVYALPSEAMIQALADRIVAHDFAVRPVLADLFSSAAFFDPVHEGVRIKSPVEYVLLDISMYKGQPQTDRLAVLTEAMDNLGQRLLAPPNVAGWPGHHAWLSTESLPRRWDSASTITNSVAAGVDYWTVMERYTDAHASHSAVSFALNLAEAVFAIPLALVEVPEINQPFAGNIEELPLPDDLMSGPAYRINLVKLFLGSTPWYEWDPSAPTAWLMVRNYMVALAKFPEYQLS